MPPGPHERPPARPAAAPTTTSAPPSVPASPSRPLSTELFELGAPRHYVRLTSVLRRQVLLEPQRIRSSCVGRQRGLAPHARWVLLQPAPAAPPAAPPALAPDSFEKRLLPTRCARRAA